VKKKYLYIFFYNYFFNIIPVIVLVHYTAVDFRI